MACMHMHCASVTWGAHAGQRYTKEKGTSGLDGRQQGEAGLVKDLCTLEWDVNTAKPF